MNTPKMTPMQILEHRKDTERLTWLLDNLILAHNHYVAEQTLTREDIDFYLNDFHDEDDEDGEENF